MAREGDSFDQALPPSKSAKSTATINEIKDEVRAVTNITSAFSEETSVHGLSFVLNDHFRPWKRLLWLLIVIASSGIMIWQIRLLVDQYRKFETNSSIKIRAKTTLDFPEVTVCNLNAFQESRMESTGINLTATGQQPQTHEEVDLIAQPLEDFIVSTSFNNEDLDISEVWERVFSYNSVCFRFSGKGRLVYNAGFLFGLNFELNINSVENTPYSGLEGVIVYVAEPGATEMDQMPFTGLTPGSYYHLGLQRDVFLRETLEPWSNCVGSAPSYTQPLCLSNCYASQLRNQCGCRQYNDMSDDMLPLCQNFTECESKLKVTDCEIDCELPPCFETVYSSTASSSRVVDSGGISLEDYLQVNINYDTMRETTTTETRSLSTANLLASIGGQMGLFMGVSLLSVIEVFGELISLRLLPRWISGETRIYGIGSYDNKEA